jgi:hypothetical protein
LSSRYKNRKCCLWDLPHENSSVKLINCIFNHIPKIAIHAYLSSTIEMSGGSIINSEGVCLQSERRGSIKLFNVVIQQNNQGSPIFKIGREGRLSIELDNDINYQNVFAEA